MNTDEYWQAEHDAAWKRWADAHPIVQTMAAPLQGWAGFTSFEEPRMPDTPTPEASMLQAAITSLASIDAVLGLSEDGCNSPARTLAAIRTLRAIPAQPAAEPVPLTAVTSSDEQAATGCIAECPYCRHTLHLSMWPDWTKPLGVHFQDAPTDTTGTVFVPASEAQWASVEWAIEWLRNNYQDHLNIASLCDAMRDAGRLDAAPACDSDAACRFSVWWTHNRARFTTARQAAIAAWEQGAPAQAGLTEAQIAAEYARDKALCAFADFTAGVRFAERELRAPAGEKK